MQVRSLGQEDPLEKGMVTQSSILAWRILWTEEPSGRQSMGLKRVGCDWACTHVHVYPTTVWSPRGFPTSCVTLSHEESGMCNDRIWGSMGEVILCRVQNKVRRHRDSFWVSWHTHSSSPSHFATYPPPSRLFKGLSSLLGGHVDT